MADPPVLTGIALILKNVGDVITSAVTWMGSFLSEITAEGNEILLLFVLVPVVGLGIGLCRRMLRV